MSITFFSLLNHLKTITVTLRLCYCTFPSAVHYQILNKEREGAKNSCSFKDG